jgi:hypothetical protein
VPGHVVRVSSQVAWFPNVSSSKWCIATLPLHSPLGKVPACSCAAKVLSCHHCKLLLAIAVLLPTAHKVVVTKAEHRHGSEGAPNVT